MKRKSFLTVILIAFAFIGGFAIGNNRTSYNMDPVRSLPSAVTAYIPISSSVTDAPASKTTKAKKASATATPKITKAPKATSTPKKEKTQTYILNKSTKKFHYPSCSSVKQMKDSNKITTTKSRSEIIADGYDPCGRCHP